MDFKRNKIKFDDTIDKFKARLVAKGFTQRECINYFDTHSYITRITTNCIQIALVAIHKLKVHQINIKTAFLNDDLEEEIYIDQPEGFMVS